MSGSQRFFVFVAVVAGIALWFATCQTNIAVAQSAQNPQKNETQQREGVGDVAQIKGWPDFLEQTDRGGWVYRDPVTGHNLELNNFDRIEFFQAQITNGQKLPLTISGRSADGEIANLDELTISVEPVDAGSVTERAALVPGGHLARWFIPADGFVGLATLTISAKNEAGDALSETVAINVTGPLAETIVVEFGDAVDK